MSWWCAALSSRSGGVMMKPVLDAPWYEAVIPVAGGLLLIGIMFVVRWDEVIHLRRLRDCIAKARNHGPVATAVPVPAPRKRPQEQYKRKRRKGRKKRR